MATVRAGSAPAWLLSCTGARFRTTTRRAASARSAGRTPRRWAVGALSGLAVSAPSAPPPAGVSSLHALRLRRLALDPFEALLLAILGALSLWTVAVGLWQATAHGLVWAGSDTVFPADAMQSMSWIQGIVHHGASPDLYVLARTPADFIQPLVGISAAVTALGVAPYLVMLLWKPVAVAAIFFAVRAYVRATLTGRWPRLAALTLALFFAWGSVIGDSWIPWWSWGYPFALISLSCSIGALLAYARDRAAGRIGALPALLGALASWLHPWQGETLIVILLGCELVMGLRGERVRIAPLALTVAFAALPLGYFALLVHFDAVWQREREAGISTYPLARVVEAFAPLALAAALAYRGRPISFIALTARIWPFAAATVFLFSEWQGSGPTHALLGASVPLAVLAVEGVRSLPWGRAPALARATPALALALVAALTIPGTISIMGVAKHADRVRFGNPHYLTPGENAALAYLAREPRPGGVIAPFHLGMDVPPVTARQTYVGNCYWSEPNCQHRSKTTERLLAGELSRAQADSLVQASGARFVLGDCHSRDISSLLAPITLAVRHFSCATLYIVR